MSNFLKSIQPTLNELVYDLTGVTVREMNFVIISIDFFRLPIDLIRIKNYLKMQLFIDQISMLKKRKLINISKGMKCSCSNKFYWIIY
jgi:hypothetical protein